MNIIDQKKNSHLVRVRWLRIKFDRDEVEYLAGKMLLIFGYCVCLGLLILMAISR
jgi:hypothetical protein